MNADADLLPESVIIHNNRVIMMLVQQTADDATGDFTYENVRQAIKDVELDSNVHFTNIKIYEIIEDNSITPI